MLLGNSPVVKSIKCPFVVTRKSSGGNHRRVKVCGARQSPLTREREGDTAIASAAARPAVRTRLVCPAHGCVPLSSIRCCLPGDSATRATSGNWERPWDKQMEMGLHFFSCLWTNLVHNHWFWLFLQLILAGPRFCYFYILIKINVKL